MKKVIYKVQTAQGWKSFKTQKGLDNYLSKLDNDEYLIFTEEV